ncbi:MAG: mRNA surveillance protein pelota [Nanoarchaeota archaeon]|nr:mRNA surveillance protein pelota [Nanoarchaeota archaeon]
MRVLKKDYKKGYVKLVVQSLDDLWYLSKIVGEGDIVSGLTYRKLSVNEKEGERKRVYLKIRVEKVEFTEFSNNLKILGVITEARDERVAVGDHHSFILGTSSEIEIEKEWNSVDKNYLIRSEQRKDIDLLIVACDYGDASFAYYHEYGLEHAGTLSEELGGKKELKAFEKNKEEYLKKLLETINETARNRGIKKILIGGASMITDSLNKLYKNYDYLKDKTFLAKINYSGRNGINELIQKGEVDKIIKDNVYSENVKIVNKLLELISKNGKATYGFKQVKKAAEASAVSDLLITDNTIAKYRQENKYEELDRLILTAEGNKAKIHIIPSNTEHGEAVDNLTGIAAILRYNIE